MPEWTIKKMMNNSALDLLYAMTKETIANSVAMAEKYIAEGKYEEARVFLVNAVEGIDIIG